METALCKSRGMITKYIVTDDVLLQYWAELSRRGVLVYIRCQFVHICVLIWLRISDVW